MPEFRSAFSKRERFPSNVGSREFPLFEFDEKGELVVKGKTDVYAQIQTYKDQVLLSKIVDRLRLTGETLTAPADCFGDSTVLPKDLLESKQLSQKVESFTSALSEEDLSSLQKLGFDDFIKQKFVAALNQEQAKKEEVKLDE